MSFLENTILEKHYVKGETLFDQGAVLEVVEVEKKLWSVMVRDNGILEVEIQNPNTKRQKSTCECNTFQKEKSCAHIATALLYLRKQESERAKKRKQKATRKQTFNIRTILDNITHEDLSKFVKSQAQSDKMFGTMLKASFARKIDLHDNSVKYESILASLIKPISTEKNASTSSDIRLALKVIEEFNSQLEDAFSLNQLEEAFFILEACLPKLHYLYSNYNNRTEKTVNLLTKFHAHIDQLYENQLAPVLLQRLDDLLLNLFQKSYYNHLESLTNIYHIAEKHQRKTVVDQLEVFIKNTSPSRVKRSNLTVFTALLIQLNLYEKINATDDTIINALTYLINMHQEDEAVAFMEYYRKTNPKNRKLEYKLVATYRQLGITSAFRTLAAELYVSNTDMRYYRMLKEGTTPKMWESILPIILKNIENLKPSSSFVARFYEVEGMTQKLIELLENESNLRHIMKYDYALYKSNYIDLERIYHKAIRKYLENHAGDIATRFIDEILHHLNQIKAHKLVTSIKNYIAMHFPHRQHLSSFS